MSRLVVNYNPNNTFALSFLDLMRKSGVFSFEEEANSREDLAHRYYDGDEFERVKSHHFFADEPEPCACNSEAEVLQRLMDSEESGVASDSEVEKVFALWSAN